MTAGGGTTTGRLKRIPQILEAAHLAENRGRRRILRVRSACTAGHVQRDSIATPDTDGFEHLRQPTDLFVQLTVWGEQAEVQARALSRLRNHSVEGTGRELAARLYKSFHDLEIDGVCTIHELPRGIQVSAAPISADTYGKAVISGIQQTNMPAGEGKKLEQALGEAAKKLEYLLRRHRDRASIA